MPEKKDNDEFKQRRNGYNKVYTRYRVPNYKNMTKPTNNTINKQQEKETNINVNQKMIEMMQTIQQNIKELNTTDRKSTRLNSSHDQISYAVFCLKKKIQT